MNKVYDIAIIGGGAAGLMAAAYASELLSDVKVVTPADQPSSPSILLLERMPRPGRKLNITGKGSCNLTNAKMWDEFAPHVHPNRQFLKSAFYNFPSSSTMKFFENLGLELVKERGDRVYPKSKRAMDVTDALVGTIKQVGVVEMLTDSMVKTVKALKEDGKEERLFEITYLMNTQQSLLYAKKILVTTGGLSYPSTGSTGDGYEIAKSFAHTIVPCYPSLTALIPAGYKENENLSNFGKSLNGLLLKNISMALKIDGNVVQEEFGDAEFTSGGLEGPLGFRVSRKAVDALIKAQKVSVIIDFKPALSELKLTARIKSDIKRALNRGVDSPIYINETKRLLKSLLPQKLIDPFILSLKSDTLSVLRNRSLSKFALTSEQLAKALKNWELEIVGYVGYERSVVTAGGVSLKEISPKTMESKLQRGLFFAGEVLDIDADTGGYNLQCAFSTAVLAISSMLQLKK